MITQFELTMKNLTVRMVTAILLLRLPLHLSSGIIGWTFGNVFVLEGVLV